MKIITAEEMRDCTRKSDKNSDVVELTNILKDKIYKEMMKAAHRCNFKTSLVIEYRSRTINLDRGDCNEVTDLLFSHFKANGYVVGGISVSKLEWISVFGNYWLYRVEGTISWKEQTE